jgi:hypothetical protein
MLNEWVRRGTISDPWDEFMIRENPEFRKENAADDLTDSYELPHICNVFTSLSWRGRYWEERFVIRKEFVPSFLDTSDIVESISLSLSLSVSLQLGYFLFHICD